MAVWDAVVVGSGPNGLAAAVRLAQQGLRVLVREAKDTIGGGVRSGALTLPGYVHDVCSAVHPLALASPFLGALPLADHGLRWVHPQMPAAHPLDDGTAALLGRSAEETAEGLGADGPAYLRLVAPLAENWERLAEDALAPLGVPRHPLVFSRFGLNALRSVRALAEGAFEGARTRALFAGLAAHGTLPLESAGTAGFALLMAALAHVVGWPFPQGGAQRLADALTSLLAALGGAVETGAPVNHAEDLPACRAALFDVAPPQLLAIGAKRLSEGYRRSLSGHRRGLGVFKLDWALGEPIPWRSADCSRTATVHLGGTFDEIAAGEAALWRGEHPERPFVILVQHSLFDTTRAPAGRHTAWAYCHVPNGSGEDMTRRIEAQVERFAPGFRDTVLARSVMFPADLERHNPNCLGGDISGGVPDLRHLFSSALPPGPYGTSLPDWFLCSASTPPGGGVHGMCGFHGARTALRKVFHLSP